MDNKILVIVIGVLLVVLVACTPKIITIPVGENKFDLTPTETNEIEIDSTPTPTTEPPRVLTICMEQEPVSLFLYGDITTAARNIREAIYDGPFDIINNEAIPVILQKIPSPTDDDIVLSPREVLPGTLIVDSSGNWVSLQDGVSYFPTGCTTSECIQTYEGQDPVQMDEMRVQFKIIPGLQWSDGVALTSQDSVYSFSVYKELFENISPENLRFTRSYEAIDDQTVEWVGIPGFRGAYLTKFFVPLPKHLWENIASIDLFSADVSARTPLGWGPYMIEEWTPGDHISLKRNPNYFRAADGLPNFDNLVYRFVNSPIEALDALVVGECDFIDQSVALENQISRLQTELNTGNLTFSVHLDSAWELAAFGIETLTTDRFDLFERKEVRQAIAHCIDRQTIVDQFFDGVSVVPDSFVASSHPLANPDILTYEFDPEKAASLFAAAGWVDFDQNSETPLTSSGISGIPDGTPFKFTYLVPNDAERPDVAEFIANGLRQCGIGIDVVQVGWSTLLGPGPDGPVFGRRFDMAQFAWAAAVEPACYLFMSSEIPGEYPAYPKGWGGANLSGYQNPEFDEACQQAMFSIPGSDEHTIAHYKAQLIFTEDLPVIPLYQHVRINATRSDWCNVLDEPKGLIQHLEWYDYGDYCQ